MKKGIKKVLAISILSMGVLSLAPSALCVSHGISGSNTAHPQFGNNQKVYQDHHRLISGEDRNSHVNTFGENVNTLIYHPGSFDAGRFHTILRMNGVDSNTPDNNSNKHEWKCEIYFGGNGCVKYIKNYNEPLDSPLRKTIMFSFNPNIMIGEAKGNVINKYNNFLTACGFSTESIIKFNNIKSITVPEGVTSIGDYAFDGCKFLKEIEIPNSVTSLGKRALSACTSLEEINIPNSITKIGKFAFMDCLSLRIICLPNSITSLDDFVFSKCSSLEEVCIPNSVTSIGNFTFSKCSGLRKVIIPEGVKSIGNSAFNRCKCIQEIKIPESVTSIGEYAFYGCKCLQKIHIPMGNSKISKFAFGECESLKEIEIPEGIESIDNYAFQNCVSLKKINIPKSVQSIGKSVFNKCKYIE